MSHAADVPVEGEFTEEPTTRGPIEPASGEEAEGAKGESQPASAAPAPRSTTEGAAPSGADQRASGAPRQAPAPTRYPNEGGRGEEPAQGVAGEPSGSNSPGLLGPPRSSRERPSPAVSGQGPAATPAPAQPVVDETVGLSAGELADWMREHKVATGYAVGIARQQFGKDVTLPSLTNAQRATLMDLLA
jgi:hypothetical protein